MKRTSHAPTVAAAKQRATDRTIMVIGIGFFLKQDGCENNDEDHTDDP